MLLNLLHKVVLNKSTKDKDKTMIYLSHAITLFLISFLMTILAGYLSWINAKESMVSTQVVITFALIICSVQVFIRFLDVVFEAIKYEYDKG